MPDIDSDDRFVGWATCAHSPEDRERLAAEYLTLDHETLLWRIALLSAGTVECDADQWVRVVVQGVLFPRGAAQVPYLTSIQGDTFHQALTETYLRWLARHDVVCGVEDRPWV